MPRGAEKHPLNLIWVIPAKGVLVMPQVFKTNLVISEYLSSIDFAIMAFFVLVYLIVPKVMAKSTPSQDSNQEYLLMGRGLTLPMFVATLVATWYGGIFGVTQIAFLHGVYSFFTQGLFWYVAYLVFAIFLAKKIREKKVLSLPELIGQKFGERARKVSAIILFFHALPLTYAVSVGLFLQLALGLEFMWALIIGVFIVAIYTSLGGFRGVVLTDCLQFILMFAAVLMVTAVLMYQYGTFNFLRENLPAHYFDWKGERQFTSAIIWLFIACTSTFIHPVFYQRCLAAKSDRVAIRGILIAMAFWLLFDFCTCIGGMYARVLLPHADSAQAYMLLGIQLLPEGLRGIFVSGILATILSTLDSFMFVSGTSISYDLLGDKRFLKNHAHAIAILFCAVFVIAMASIFGTDFEATWLFREGSFSTALLVPVLAAVICRRKFSELVFMACATGAILTFAVVTYLKEQNLVAIEPFYTAHGVALVTFIVTSYLDAQSKAKLTNRALG